MATTHFIHIRLTPRNHRRRSRRYVISSINVEELGAAENILTELTEEYNEDCRTKLGPRMGTGCIGALAILSFEEDGVITRIFAPRIVYQTNYPLPPSDWALRIINTSQEV